ncbi:MAG TPA: tRNA (adenosine(37)-N6)-dimethylallyltransferase MiaA [Nitrolancea sp.]|nr:tRNA (adenosine(37)-N6)-dimethylallyltransferase MiaA [Nitrolancea sp.]
MAVVGPTAVGKTAAAIRLARDLAGEVVSADSRYLYRGLDIGTAKPSEEEMAGVPHHLIDVVEPTQDYSLAIYQADAYRTIDRILDRGRLPILAGGTPLYVNALLEGWRIPEVPPDPTFREAMAQVAEDEGPAVLHARLAMVDPLAADRIPMTNVRRVVRALEIHRSTGRPMTEIEGKQPPPYDVLTLGLMVPRDELYRRIDRRIEEQIAGGWIEEVQRLLGAGLSPAVPAMSAIGYREIADYLAGTCSLAEASDRIKYHTHRYARHQLTWLKRMPGIHWFDPREPSWYDEMLGLARDFLTRSQASRPN